MRYVIVVPLNLGLLDAVTGSSSTNWPCENHWLTIRSYWYEIYSKWKKKANMATGDLEHSTTGPCRFFEPDVGNDLLIKMCRKLHSHSHAHTLNILSSQQWAHALSKLALTRQLDLLYPSDRVMFWTFRKPAKSDKVHTPPSNRSFVSMIITVQSLAPT